MLVLLERVNEAQRLAARELREIQADDSKKNKRKRKQNAVDGDEGGASGGQDVIRKASQGDKRKRK